MVRRQHFRRFGAGGAKITHRRLALGQRQTVLAKTAQATPTASSAVGERWGVTTSSKFKARKFWRGVMRPLAPVRSGGARGRVRSGGLDVEPPIPRPAKAHCGCSQEVWLHAVNDFASWPTSVPIEIVADGDPQTIRLTDPLGTADSAQRFFRLRVTTQ